MNNLKLLEVHEFNNKRRLGAYCDGGYVIGLLEGEYDCYISAGISNEESFTRDFLNTYNIDKSNSFAFDGTIEDYPYQYTKNITFIKKNIGDINNEQNDNLFSIIEKYDNIFLKMDIEGGEYPWLLSLNESQLKKFKQIVIEFHGINDDSWNFNYSDKIKCLQKLKDTHYIIHAHGNNFSHTTNNIPDVIELTYINKSYFKDIPKLNTKSIPIPGLDYPNWHVRNEIYLNFYPFVNL